MSRLTLEVSMPPVLKDQVSYKDALFLIGSCFTENMGDKFLYYKWTVLQNPHGILFNPMSIIHALTDCLENRHYTVQDLFYFDELYHSWQHHSRFSCPVATDSVQAINQSIGDAHAFIKKANWVIITLGSAFVYELKAPCPFLKNTGIVANNHKAPDSWFSKKLLTVHDITSSYTIFIEKLKAINPHCRILFNVSPVRHLREGAVMNNLSKGVLFQSVHQLCVHYPHACFYLPSYEIIMDELRDYRFFSEDLVHPNYLATNYVWDKISNHCFDKPTREYIKLLSPVLMAQNHKPFNPHSAKHQAFLIDQRKQLRALLAKYPELSQKI
ncbi:MAG: GSCFA domain-containing protein [Phycisphaerales bacterium]|nr:GSCFA domain-containing protein [Phycisphaerales bacterium]